MVQWCTNTQATLLQTFARYTAGEKKRKIRYSKFNFLKTQTTCVMKPGGIRRLCWRSPHTSPISGISTRYISCIAPALSLKWIRQTDTHACADTDPCTASLFVRRTLMLAHDCTGVRCPVKEHKWFQNILSSDTVILFQDAQTRETFRESWARVLTGFKLAVCLKVEFTLITRLWGRGQVMGQLLEKVACGWMRLILELSSY